MKQFVVLFGNWKRPISFLVVLVALWIPRNVVEASNVKLAWDPSLDSRVTGYRVYYGQTSGQYAQWLDVGSSTNATISGLADGTTYYFAACAYTSTAVSSEFSNELAYASPLVSSNAPPVAVNSSLAGVEDQSLSVVLNGTDPNGNSLTYTIVTPPAHGSLTGTPPNLTYWPATDFNGTDALRFKANDGQLDSGIATVSINIAPVNDSPRASGATVTTTENTRAGVTLSGSDADGDALTYTVVSLPAHGSLTGTAPNLSYLPATNYSGSDSLTFKVSDGRLESATATVSFTITPANHAPAAVGASFVVAEDASVSVTLRGSDTDGDSLTYTVVTPPVRGTLTGTAPNVLYRPQSNYYGADTFTFKVSDGRLESPAATVSISVTPVNDPPVAQSRSMNTLANTPVNVGLTGSDAEGDSLTYQVASLPVHGALTGQPPALTYTPQQNYWGSDSFTFVARDGQTSSSPATISISVKKSNSAPNGRGKKVNTVQGAALAITLEADDPDGDLVTYQVVSAPANGTLSGQAPNLTYTPRAEFVGADRIEFVVSDGISDSVPAVVSVAVVATDLVPQFTRVFVNPAGLHLTWTAVVGKTYRLKYRTSLNPTVWTDVGEELVADSTRVSWVDNAASSESARFYIVELVDP